MPRIRTIKPEFFASEDVSALPLRARLTWIGLWTQCDDHGRTKDNVKLIKAALWPLDDISLRDVEEDLATLADRGRIVRYTVGDGRFLVIVNWHFHQSVNRPGRPKCPPPPVPLRVPEKDDTGHCALCYQDFRAHGGLTEPSRPVDNSTVDVSAGQQTHGVFSESSVSQHGDDTEDSRQEGKGTGKGKEGTRASARDGRAPSHQCPRHARLPPDEVPPCRACGDARKAAEAAVLAELQAEAEARSTEARIAAQAKASAIANCSLCDEDGYAGSRLCDHDPTAAARAARGRAGVDAVLASRSSNGGKP